MLKAFLALLPIFAVLTVNPANSGENPQFIFPVACTLGADCWSIDYVDTDPVTSSAKDFNCGPRSKDDHKGTDFALRSLAEMSTGVDVLAAKDGKVVRLRDGESDTPKTKDELEKIKAQQKECGNAVLLDHGSGLQTLYCHMKGGSLVVKKGEAVKAGQKIGQVGHSGETEFPHLHFGVVWEGGVIDPYTGMLNTDGCGKMKQSLWAVGQPMNYKPVTFYDGGFLDKIPDFTAIQNGAQAPENLSTNAQALVFWVGLYGVQQGDSITLVIHDPEGGIFIEKQITQEDTRVRQYYYTGRKLDNRALAAGLYKGTATLMREGLDEIKIEKVIAIN